MQTSSSPIARQSDHPRADRFDTAMAVDVAGGKAQAHNISATGVYFETEIDMPLGALVNLNVQFTHGGRKHWIACEGRVVRVTDANGQHGIGAQLVTPFFSGEEETVTALPAKRR